MRSRQIFFLCVILCFLLSCASEQAMYTPPEYGPGATVAVWELEDLSVIGNPLLSDMQAFFADTIASTLKEQGRFQLIERQRLALALTELHLGSAELASEGSRLKVGQILGAQFMVFGGYQMLGEELRFDLRMVAVESGAVVSAAEHTVRSADTADWIRASEDVAARLIEKKKPSKE